MIIASITTIPDRYDSLISVLEALSKQTMCPELLLITISDFYPRTGKYYPVEDILKLSNYLNTYPIETKIIRHKVDAGSLYKILSPLEYVTKNDFIVLLDDDNPLPEDTIQLLIEGYHKHGKAVYGCVGSRNGFFGHGEELDDEDNYWVVDVLGGYRGVLISGDIIDKLFMKLWVNMFIERSKDKMMICMHDDHIISYYFKYLNIERRIIKIHREFIYNPIANDNGIFADKKCDASMDIIKDILKEQGIFWIYTNKH